MSIPRKILALGRTLFRKGRLDADVNDEVQGYVDELAERKVRDGLDPKAARRAALIELGGVEQVKERVRDVRTGNTLDTVLQDIRYACRGLRRSPGFAIVAILTLGLGVGANTAIFSVLDAVLLRRAPIANFDRLVMLWETDRQTGTTREPASLPDFLDYQRLARAVDRIGVISPTDVNAATSHGEPMRLAALAVSRDLLPMLGFAPILGRHFSEAEDRAGGPRAVLISESLWTRAFGRDPRILGQVLRVDEEAVPIVGVVPDSADFGVVQMLTAAAYARAFADRGERVRVDAWLPLHGDPKTMTRDGHGLLMVGRLAPGVDVGVAQHELAAIAADLETAYPGSNRGRGIHVEALGNVVFGPARPALVLLLGAVVFVLLVACVNVANLLLARAASRTREVAIRAALGAGAARLTRQFAIESLLLAVAGGAAGLAFASAGLGALVALAPADIPRLSSVGIDWRVMTATLGLSVIVGLAFGLVPALRGRQADLHEALGYAGETRVSGSRWARRQRRALVVAEVSLAVVLLAGAGLLIRSFWRVAHVDPGFRANGILKVEYQLPVSRYPVDFRRWPDFKEFHAFSQALLSRAAALPGVRSVALAGNHPLDPGFTNSFVIVGREAESKTFPEVGVRRVTAGYFGTVGLGLRRGRLLDDRDSTAAPAVLVINRAAEQRFFPRAEAIGAKVRFWGASRTIVGIVDDERFKGLDEAAPIAVYTPLAQTPSANGAGVLLMRTEGDPTALAPAARRVFRDLDPGLAVFGIEPLADTVSRSLSARRFLAVLLALFAAVAIGLAGIGIHGVLAYGVAQRTREFGVRMALGARRGQVMWGVVREAFALTLIGLVIGTGAALMLARFLAGQLFGVTPADLPTFAAVTAFLAVVAVTAAAVPARHATNVDPTVALRAE